MVFQRTFTFTFQLDNDPIIKLKCKLCSSRKNPYPPQGRSSEVPSWGGGGGVLKVKILEAKYEAKLEFPGGGMQNKKPSVGGVWIFSGTAH